jgi:alkanesulfonate monooxygenase SsuD/methylene tetrahydromethanopterin reductase-like flavin-dependent oxidoreductase (luciferase family)
VRRERAMTQHGAVMSGPSRKPKARRAHLGRSWGREHVAAAARRAGRDPAAVKWVGFVRVCIDEDADAARRTFAASLLRYGLVRPGVRGSKATAASSGAWASRTF